MNEEAQRRQIGAILAARADETGITEHNIAARSLFDKDPRKYDVITDINPEVIDDRSDDGNKVLGTWRELISALSSENRYTMLARLELGPDPSIINDGIGQAPTAVLTAYIRIFDNASPNDLHYGKGEGDSFVALKATHTLLKVTFGNTPTQTEDTMTMIAAQNPESDIISLTPDDLDELELELSVASDDDPMVLYNELLRLIRVQLPAWEQSARDMHVRKAMMDWVTDQERTSQEPLSS